MSQILTVLLNQRGWRGMAVCFAAGGLTTLAFAPFDLWPVLFLTLPLFLLMLENASGRFAHARAGFAFGYGHAIAGTYWIANALLVDAEKFGWLYPISVLGLSAVMALWFALFGALFGRVCTKHRAVNLVRFAVLWVVVEYLRSWGMFGFPWNLLGSAVLASERVAQVISLVGTYGASLCVLLLCLQPALWCATPTVSERGRNAAAILSVLAILAAYGVGMVRMPTQSPLSSTRLRVVQPNIPQNEKWLPEGRMDSLHLLAGLTDMGTDGTSADIIVWPETAIPFTLYPDSVWPSRLSELLHGEQLLFTGAMRAEGMDASLQLYNSLAVVNGAGALSAVYNKHQLVPFGEFVPLRSVLPLEKITPGTLDFSRGGGPQTITVGAAPPFSPLVCYEVIFPWITLDKAHRPDWLVNVTNDAWYGDSPGPYQHLAAARLRALEQGLPLVRAANTGISAVIDPYGRVLHRLALNQRGVIDAALPQKRSPTLYSQCGEVLTFLVLLISFAMTHCTKTNKKSKQ